MDNYDNGVNLIVNEYEKFFDSIKELKNKIKAIYEKINAKLENPEEVQKAYNEDKMNLCTQSVKTIFII